MMVRRDFRAMGTEVQVVLDPAGDDPGAIAALDRARDEIARIERLASRFTDDSELSRLNACGGMEVSTDLMRLITVALAMRDATSGGFDPTVHDAVAAAGYDRPLDRLPLDGPAPGPAMPVGGDVTVDLRTGRVTLGPGARIDLGGIAKGWTADRVADMLGTHGPCLVSIGGDIAVRGLHDGRPWPIAVAPGATPRVIGLRRGGLATSGTDRRRWRRAGREMHHVIDPATGRPAQTDLVRVTAIADDAAGAEAWATALLLLGRERARREAVARGITVVLVGTDGRTTTTGGLAWAS